MLDEDDAVNSNHSSQSSSHESTSNGDIDTENVDQFAENLSRDILRQSVKNAVEQLSIKNRFKGMCYS
jgi:hypothetical protein